MRALRRVSTESPPFPVSRREWRRLPASTLLPSAGLDPAPSPPLRIGPKSGDRSGTLKAVTGRTARVRAEEGTVVCERCLLADSPWLRMKGLLGRSALAEEEGVLLRPASAIHTLLMRFPIDAVFLDRELQVLKVVSCLRPWRFAACRGAKAVLELPAGRAARVGLREDARLTLDTP
ncbi:MAG: hypothetical protein C4306_11510 [Thermoleophilia bacterium]